MASRRTKNKIQTYLNCAREKRNICDINAISYNDDTHTHTHFGISKLSQCLLWNENHKFLRFLISMSSVIACNAFTRKKQTLYYTLDVWISIKPQYCMSTLKESKEKKTKEKTKESCVKIRTHTHIKNEIIFICETATNCIESFTIRHNIFRNVVISILVP